MQKLFILIAILAASCNQKKKEPVSESKYVSLRTDTVNVVKLSDTLVIYEGTCRGCAYENSTSFSISDSSGTVELYHIDTEDNNPRDMDGGNISKNLILIPKKTGSATFTMYKFFDKPENAEDSAKGATAYSILVNN